RAVFGEESEAVPSGPGLDLGEHRVMARPAGLQSFLEDVVELRVHRVQERERRRRRVLLLLPERLDVEEVEVEATELLLPRRLERPLGDRVDGDAGREREGFLRAGDRDVETPLV